MPNEEILKGSGGGISCYIIEGRNVLDVIAKLFGFEAATLLRSLGKLMICEGVFKEVYIVSGELINVIKVIFKSGRIPYSAGLYLGRLRREKPKLIPSVNTIQIIYDKLGFRRALIVREEGIKPFLYGNDIIKKSVIKCIEPLELGDIVGIVGEDNYVYGVGLSVIGSCNELNSLKDNDMVARNIFDVGWYLRGGTEVRERMFKL